MVLSVEFKFQGIQKFFFCSWHSWLVGVQFTCKEMACLGNATDAVLGRSPLNSLPTRTRFLSGAHEIRFPAATPSLPNRLVRSVTNGRARRRISANAGQCAERNAETDAKKMIQVADSSTFVDSEIRTALLASLEGDGITIGENWLDLLRRSRLADMQASEAFATSRDITEAKMERLVESLLHEEGQSTEDYRQRAIMFGKIAEFFSQRKSYIVERRKNSWTGASEISRTMQVIVDDVLAEEGRSATDYNCRAQLFAKSAEVFPFTADLRSS